MLVWPAFVCFNYCCENPCPFCFRCKWFVVCLLVVGAVIGSEALRRCAVLDEGRI